MPKRILRALAPLAVACSLTASPSSAIAQGLTAGETRQLDAFAKWYNSLPEANRGGHVYTPPTTFPSRREPSLIEELKALLPQLSPQGRMPASSDPSGASMLFKQHPFDEITEQLNYDHDYISFRRHLMQNGFLPYVVEQRPCDNKGMEICDSFPEVYNCIFDDDCTAYWSHRERGWYMRLELLSIDHARPIVRGTGRLDQEQVRQAQTEFFQAEAVKP